jgi:septum formation protein
LRIVLASSSPIRAALLEQAGVEFDTVSVHVDEEKAKSGAKEAADIASTLAQAKALAGSDSTPGAWTIGSDSVVAVDGRIFNKPRNRDEAKKHLGLFSGQVMELTSAVALARDGNVNWSFCDTARLQVRKLSNGFIDDYLDAEWPEIGYCVGVFRLEGRGVQLFDSIEGSYFTILGMPLLPLLRALRERGAMAE